MAVQDRLAAATLGETPADVEVLDLTPRPGLPGFVYVHSIVSPEPIYLNPDSTLSTAVYGITRLTQPWLLHPTEVLDGAVCGSFFSGDFYRWFTWPLDEQHRAPHVPAGTGSTSTSSAASWCGRCGRSSARRS